MTVVNLRRPVVFDGKVTGVLASTITVRALSEFVTSLETEFGQNAFILYDHDRVLAHSTLALDFPGLGVERPLPRVDEIGDPVLFGIWSEGWQDRRLEIDVPGHTQRLGDAQYVYLYQALAPPLNQRWLVGSYFTEQAVDAQLNRLALAAGLGLLALLVAVIAAVLLGRRVSRPIGRWPPQRARSGPSISTTSRRCAARGSRRSTRPRSRSTRWSGCCACSPSTCRARSSRA